jgi:DNA-binding IclR family transcriptional regulator
MTMPRHTETEALEPTQTNISSEKLLSLIEAMSELQEPARLLELSQKLQMNSSTVLRFLAALQHRGYVARDIDTGRYYLTFKLCGIAQNISANMSLRNISLPFLRNISRIFGESANLSIEYDMSVMYIEVVNSPGKTLISTQRIGNIAPMHCTGVGKLLLLNYTSAQMEQMAAVKGLVRFTASTLTSLQELTRAVEEAREKGYAFDNEECEAGVRCIAVPVRDYTGRVVAGISVSGPATRMTDHHIFENLPSLIEMAQELSHRLGWECKG